VHTLRSMLMLTCLLNLGTPFCTRYGGFIVQKLGRHLSDGYDLFGRWELTVAVDIYITNGSGSNIGAHTYNTYQYT
jgi:hypothetical protein